MLNPDFSNILIPGVTIEEKSEGFQILELASFSTVYMFGTATAGEYTPQVISSYNDFKNKFPGSGSDSYAQILFESSNLAARADNAFYFIRVGIANTFKIRLLNVTPGTVALTINGTTVSTVIQSGDTLSEVIATLISVVNADLVLSGLVSALPGGATDEFLIVADNFETNIAISGNTPNTSVTEQTSLTPRSTDYVQAILNSFSVYELWPQGFVLAPEAFSTYDTTSERQAVGRALESLASGSRFDWFALIDPGADITTVQQLLAERALYSSPQGHSSMFAPYQTSLRNELVPPSVVVVGEAIRAIRTNGFKQPFAGTKFTLNNVLTPPIRYTDSDQGLLNPQGVNLIRELRGLGTVIWGARTLATDTNYTQIPGRITMNAFNGTVRQVPGLYNLVFDPIQSNGEFLIRLTQTLTSIARRFWKIGAFYGNTENDAFRVICDSTNNSDDQLNLGQVYAVVYAATTPSAEKILVHTIKVPIGQVPQV